MKVPFFSNDLIDPTIKQSWIDAFEEVISRDSLISGTNVKLFEEEFASMVGAEHGIATSNGLDGLVLALRTAKIGPGDLVAVPSHTFIATHLAVIHVGATPYSVDVDQFGLIDLDLLLESKKKFKAVIPVHMHGSMVDMIRLSHWAKQESVIVIEDASQAHGCQRDGLQAGVSGDLSVFSLYPTKNLGALGDAGIIVTSNGAYSEYLKSIRNYGSSSLSKYLHPEIGYNNRLDTIQASFLRINLRELDGWNIKRNQLARRYIEKLRNLPLKFQVNQNQNSVYHHFPILVEDREALQKFLSLKGVGTEIHYPNLASFEIEKLTGVISGKMEIGQEIAQKTLSLPMSQWHKLEHVDYVSETIIEFYGESR
jgi:dTDP-4-amino-4,6-dideoxygalactose transaminase